MIFLIAGEFCAFSCPSQIPVHSNHFSKTSQFNEISEFFCCNSSFVVYTLLQIAKATQNTIKLIGEKVWEVGAGWEDRIKTVHVSPV
jgi:hypothetical protein